MNDEMMMKGRGGTKSKIVVECAVPVELFFIERGCSSRTKI
jgi:hypothetical protein